MARRKQDTGLLSFWQEGNSLEEDGLRILVERVVQRVLEEEMTAFLGAESYQRSEERSGYRNGYKPRTLKTRVGTLELQVPQDRQGRFRTEVFERYQRSEKALLIAVARMYVNGVSTRKVKKITQALCGLEISRSSVSRLSRELDEEISHWQSRPLEKEYPYLVVDAHYEKIRRGARVVSAGVLKVVGIGEDGFRETLGIWTADTESEATWGDVFRELRERGLRGVRYVVSDAHKGLVSAVGRHFQGASWQRCQVHFLRNVLGKVRKGERGRVSEILRRITESGREDEARRRLAEACDELEDYPQASRLLEEHGEEILAVYSLPAGHRRRLRSTNMVERLNSEFRRRSRVVRIFPNEASCVRLMSALAMEFNEEWLERRYLKMEVLEPVEEEAGGREAA